MHVCSEELSSLLTDLVVDAQSCGASWVARGDVEGDSRAIVGVCLASAHSLIERQTDRIFSYDFREPKLHTAVEFVKFVLNKVRLVFSRRRSLRGEGKGRGVSSPTGSLSFVQTRDEASRRIPD